MPQTIVPYLQLHYFIKLLKDVIAGTNLGNGFPLQFIHGWAWLERLSSSHSDFVTSLLDFGKPCPYICNVDQ